jgi:TPR repeat protein
MVGALLDRDEDGSQDAVEACGWYRKAADQGHALAQFALGMRYDCGGLGVDQDYALAHFWYLEAANHGHGRAQFNLGVMYASGQGTERDLLQAWCWLQRAAGAGVPGAARYAERVRARMAPEQFDKARSLLVQHAA